MANESIYDSFILSSKNTNKGLKETQQVIFVYIFKFRN